MNFKTLQYSLLIALGMASTLWSCADLDLAPTNKFTELNYWTSAEKAALVLNTAYNSMDNMDVLYQYEALSDNMFEGRGSSDERMVSSGRADAFNGRFATTWKDSYEGIKVCHVFLGNVDRVPNMDGPLKERMKAEARFIRAFLYFRLTTWYGDVPLFTEEISLADSKTIGRTPKEDVLQFIHDELSAIEPLLPTKDEYKESDNGRITRGAAVMLKARAYLYNSDWNKVITECEKLMSGSYGSYGLFPSYEGLFMPENEYNQEVILDYAYVPQVRTWDLMRDMAPLSMGARINSKSPTQELVDEYIMTNGLAIGATNSGYDENNPYVNRDPRLSGTVVYHGFQWKKPDGSLQTIYIRPGSTPEGGDSRDEFQGVGANASSSGYYIRKYYDPQSEINFTSGLNRIQMRYGDVLLMYAEAKAELGLLNQTVWDATIKELRQRAGFKLSSALTFDQTLSKEQLISLVRTERRSELALEGLRIFDIRRWKIAERVLNGYPHGARFGETGVDNGYIRLDRRSFNPARDYLWAIPASQRDLNPNLTQNQGY